MVFYIVAISISIIVSYKGGIEFSTSVFTLLNIKGFKSFYNNSTYSFVLKSPNLFLNSSTDPNLTGSIKFNKLNNSSVEFYIGVPF
jgi:hypothetical protein